MVKKVKVTAAHKHLIKNPPRKTRYGHNVLGAKKRMVGHHVIGHQYTA